MRIVLSGMTCAPDGKRPEPSRPWSIRADTEFYETPTIAALMQIRVKLGYRTARYEHCGSQSSAGAEVAPIAPNNDIDNSRLSNRLAEIQPSWPCPSAP